MMPCSTKILTNKFFMEMKRLTILTAFAFLLGLTALHAQVEHTRVANFETTGQSLFDAGPALIQGDTFYMLKDNGKEARFFADWSIDLTPTDADGGDMPGIDVINKFGIDFDLYARYLINSGSTDIEYPTTIKFSVPANQTFGCGEEITINTSHTIDQGFSMDITEPGVEFAVGSEFNSGIFLGGRSCALDCTPHPVVCQTLCNPFPGTINEGNPSFEDANAGNYLNYLKPGFYDFLRVSSSDGLQFPWDLYGAPNPGVPTMTLPLDTDNIPGFEDLTNISGTIDNPMNELDGTDMMMGKAIVDNSNYHFMHMEFDPLQFQEYFTGIPLTFSGSIGPASMELDILSVPFILDGYMKGSFKFDPVLNTTLDFGREVSWKEMNGGTEVQSGTSQVINNFKIGNTLKLVFPDNEPLTLSPQISISNEFKTKMDLNFNASVGIRILSGNVSVEGLFDEDFAVVNTTIPIGSFPMPIIEKTFSMGGFDDLNLDPINLTPDMVPPAVTTKNITIYIPDAGGPVNIFPQDVVQSANDAHGGTVRYLDVTPKTFECANLGANNVQVTLDDNRCNPVTQAAVVTVVDRTKPTLACKSVTTYLDDNGVVQVQPQDAHASSWDNCGMVNIVSLLPNTFVCANLGPNTSVLTVNDGHGNVSTCNSTVTVIDNKPPVLVCQPKTVYLNDLGQGTIITSDVLQSAYDNCGVINVTNISQTAFDCDDLGAVLVTVYTNDSHGNNANCTAMVTVVDAVAPTVVCKNKVETFLNAAGIATITPADVFASGADNCGIVNLQSIVPNTFNCSNLGGNLVTLTVNDGHGNTGTCSMNNLSVMDIIKPTMQCRNVTLDLNANGQATLTPDQVNNGSFDNCSIVSMSLSQTFFTCEHLGSNTVTLTGFDPLVNSASCTATITVRDLIAPVTKCKSIIADLNANGMISIAPNKVNDNSFDNCAFSMVLSPNTFNCSNVGTQTVTLVSTDVSGNSSSCTAVVTVRDVTPPTSLCKNPSIYVNDQGVVNLSLAQVNNGSSDACGIASMTISQSAFDCSKIGSPRSVTMTVKDIHNNVSSCISYVSVKDTFAPTAICQNTTVNLGANGNVTVYTEALALESYDNCSVWSYSPAAKVYTTTNLGNNNLIVKVKDWSGNAATCFSTVTVLPYNSSNGNQEDTQNRDLYPITETTFDFSVFPNPASGETVTVKFDLPTEQAFTVQVFDIAGRMVYSHQGVGVVNENQLPIRLSGIAPGTYVLDFQSEGLKGQKKLIVQE
jgi:hypothetical protein